MTEDLEAGVSRISSIRRAVMKERHEQIFQISFCVFLFEIVSVRSICVVVRD